MLALISSELVSVWSESDWGSCLISTLVLSSVSLPEEHSLVLVASSAGAGDGDSMVSQPSPDSSVQSLHSHHYVCITDLHSKHCHSKFPK